MATAEQSDAIGERDRRAAEEPMAVVPYAPEMYRVYSGADSRYLVDIREGACECADWQYREPAGGCKHARRVMFATGRREIPDGVRIDPALRHQREVFCDD